MLTAKRATGEIFREDGSLLGRFYSGADPDPTRKGEPGEGVNDPSKERERSVGPLPAGLWVMRGPPFKHPHAGEFVVRLEPVPGTETFGRSHFLWHGDSKANPGTASQGCLVSPRVTREAGWNEGDHLIRVV